MSRKKVTIIGAGHNGLVCACYLAKAGFDVRMLERRNIVGGAVVTEEFHPGFRNSIASYTVSLLHPKVIKDLNLKNHGLQILERRVNNYLPLANGDALVSEVDSKAMAREVARFSKRDALALTGYSRKLDEILPVVKDIMMLTPPNLETVGLSDLLPLFKLSRQFKSLSGEQRRFMLKLFSISAGELLDDEFESEPIKALLGFDAIVGNYASPYTPGSAYVLLHHVFGEINGKPGLWGHAVGGMGAITQAMAIEAGNLGVKIETEKTVREIEMDGNRASSILLEDGTRIATDLVVSNIHPKLLYLNLLPSHALSEHTIEHFERYKSQSGTFRMNVALDELPEFKQRTTEHCLEAGIIMAPSLKYMDEAYMDARRHGWSKHPIVEMLIPSIVDSSLAPDGKHVASLFCQQFDPSIKQDWDNHRDAAAATIIDTVNDYAPNFRASIIATQIHSPWDLEKKFSLVGGDIFHGRLSLEQLFSARPMLGSGQYQTEISNVYMCGAGTHPGGGVTGIPGHNAAREIIKHN
ncbi:MAG: NAD(P)/FAD-dependent oxidoreductase [Pseudomonadales bacterium]